MTKKREWKPDDGHQHYWARQFEWVGPGKQFWLNLWVCRRCQTETMINPFQEEAKP